MHTAVRRGDWSPTATAGAALGEAEVPATGDDEDAVVDGWAAAGAVTLSRLMVKWTVEGGVV